MNVFDIIDIINNVAGLVLLLISLTGGIYLFFIDPIRRWSFFGYIPTMILALYDDETKEILTIEYIRKLTMQKQLPQGAIYNSDVLDAVEKTIQRELGLDLKYVDVSYIIELGTINAPDVKRMKKFQYGMLSLVPLVRGKGYILCICTVHKSRIIKKIDLGVGIKSAPFIGLQEFKKSLDVKELKGYKKAEMYKKIVRIIEDWLK